MYPARIGFGENTILWESRARTKIDVPSEYPGVLKAAKGGVEGGIGYARTARKPQPVPTLLLPPRLRLGLSGDILRDCLAS